MPSDARSPAPGVLDVRVLAHALCADLSFDPLSIAVQGGGRPSPFDGSTRPGGTDIGLEPGESHHDTVREWCGAFTGTFSFRAYYAPSFPYYLDVDCSG